MNHILEDYLNEKKLCKLLLLKLRLFSKKKFWWRLFEHDKYDKDIQGYVKVKAWKISPIWVLIKLSFHFFCLINTSVLSNALEVYFIK